MDPILSKEEEETEDAALEDADSEDVDLVEDDLHPERHVTNNSQADHRHQTHQLWRLGHLRDISPGIDTPINLINKATTEVTTIKTTTDIGETLTLMGTVVIIKRIRCRVAVLIKRIRCRVAVLIKRIRCLVAVLTMIKRIRCLVAVLIMNHIIITGSGILGT